MQLVQLYMYTECAGVGNESIVTRLDVFDRFNVYSLLIQFWYIICGSHLGI